MKVQVVCGLLKLKFIIERDVRDDGEYAEHPRSADGPHGDHPYRRLHRGREGRDRQAPPDPEAGGSARAESRGADFHRRWAAVDHSSLHSRSRRSHAGARAGEGRAQVAPADPREQDRARRAYPRYGG